LTTASAPARVSGVTASGTPLATAASSFTATGTLLASARMPCFAVARTLLASARMSGCTTTGAFAAVVMAAEADALAMEAAEAIVLVHAAISVIVVHATLAAMRATASRTLDRLVGGFIHVLVMIACTAVAACRAYSA